MLIDETTIFVRSGKGGDGCVSLRREKYVPKGGPDGGDGGDGGDCIIIADPHLDTLLPLTHRPHYRAKNGMQGEGKSKHGANGPDCIIPVPLGTLVFDEETGELVADVCNPDDRFIVARGGKGGFGNEHFKSATNQTPREATPGEAWVERTLRLELKLIADVGLIGLPNAGKSTFLKSVTRANPRVADYPFTTLTPNLGIASLGGRGDDRRLVLADIPGLIEGAAEGAGLGHDFLKHIERTSLLLHLLDCCPIDGSDPVQAYTTIRGELEDYSDELAAKPEIVVLNKLDLFPEGADDPSVAAIIDGLSKVAGQPPLLASGVTRAGVQEILETCWDALEEQGRDAADAEAPSTPIPEAGWRDGDAAEDSGPPAPRPGWGSSGAGDAAG